MTKAASLLNQARRLARSTTTWADFSNALFDQETGILALAFRDEGARKRFIKGPEYQEIRRLLRESMTKHGLVEGATPAKSGRFVVRVPKSLHAALWREARDEGVSLNQLVVSKLSARLEKTMAPR